MVSAVLAEKPIPNLGSPLCAVRYAVEALSLTETSVSVTETSVSVTETLVSVDVQPALHTCRCGERTLSRSTYHLIARQPLLRRQLLRILPLKPRHRDVGRMYRR